MGSWKGNPKQDVPNFIQEGDNLSDRKRTHLHLSDVEKDGENRAVQTNRGTDTFKNVGISLMDIDTIVLRQLEYMQLSVVDDGSNVKVPIYYASPEKWKSVQKDGVFRDYNGKIILPAIVFHRESSEKDPSLATFNRYLRYQVMRKFSSKNKYTEYSMLGGKNAPVNEIYDVVYPDHMIFTYRFIVWTEYIEQMNGLIEKINFETDDYWGPPRSIRLRTKVDSYSHTVELQADADRVVKTEFNLVVNGYLLPDTFNVEFGRKPTNRKIFTPKRVVLNSEVVTTDFDTDPLYHSKGLDNWRSKKYPNLHESQEPAPPPVQWLDSATGEYPAAADKDTLFAFQKAYQAANTKEVGTTWTSAPAAPDANGSEGQIAIDAQYFYVYSAGRWRRVSISQFS